MAQVTDNIGIITRFEHAFRAADQATIDELCDPGLVDHNPSGLTLGSALGRALRIPNLVELPRIDQSSAHQVLRLCHILPGIGKKFTLEISVFSIDWNWR